MTRSTASRAEARFKQLCCMGLGREAVTPAILAELRNFVPNTTSLAFFINNGKLVGGYTNNPDAALTTEVYMAEFHGKRGKELGGAFPDAVWTQYGVHDYADALKPINVDLTGFERSDFYNLIFRVQHSFWFMRLMVRGQNGRGDAVGCVTMYRGPGDKPWSIEEKRRLAGLEPFLALALRDRSPDDLPLTDSGNGGFIIADGDGRPRHFSRSGIHLLSLAVNPDVTPERPAVSLDSLPRPLQRICRNLTRVLDGDAEAPPPSWYHRNVWGGFSFRAERLRNDTGSGDLVAISIAHQEPVATRLMRRLGELPLSRRQSEVTYLLANGKSHESIAAELGISRHTAIAHGRWIYNKLDVHNRTELVNRLLAH